MRVALDTNILFSMETDSDEPKRAMARALYDQIPPASIVIPTQVIGELYRVLVKKVGLSREAASGMALSWQNANEVVGATPETMALAISLATAHQLAIWDAVVISSAVDAGCRILLSEDMRHGFELGGLTIVNPFADPPHELLVQAIDD